MAGEILDIFLASVRDGYVQVSAFVAVTVLWFRYGPHRTTGGLLVRLGYHRPGHTAVSAAGGVDAGRRGGARR